jgi:hypothetical protein
LADLTDTAAGRENARRRVALAIQVQLSSRFAVGGAFDRRGQPSRVEVVTSGASGSQFP